MPLKCGLLGMFPCVNTLIRKKGCRSETNNRPTSSSQAVIFIAFIVFKDLIVQLLKMCFGGIDKRKQKL